MTKHYAFFSHRECEFFPCQKGADPDDFNCLFCFCPLYLVSDCGGAYTRTPEGIKDCSRCLFPHRRENYDAMIKKLCDLVRTRSE